MIKASPEQRSMPEINPDKVSYIVAKAREFLIEEEGAELYATDLPEDGATQKDVADAPLRAELAQFIDDLDLDEQNALVALAWIGRGDFEPEHWEAAVALANDRRETSASNYLMGLPLLPDYLEEALADYGGSARDFDAID